MITAWPFVIGAYGVAVAGTAGLVAWAMVGLRRAEARADALDRGLRATARDPR